MPWHRSELPNASAPKGLPAVPGSDAIRQAALQASWQRDRRVAQRRIVWRWVLWYLQKYSLPLLALVSVIAVVVYLSGAWPEAATESPLAQVPSVDTRPSYTAPSVPLPRVASSEPPATAEETDPTPLSLKASTLLTAVPAPAPPAAPATSADTLSLKPETWLHSKEP
jgi:hypothetical protein